MNDPAFLFYSSDFLAGVSDLTMEERGQFITLLCLQHQKGDLSEKTIRLSVGSVSVDVMLKFRLTENGNYVNDRLSQEISKRAIYTESRRKNGQKGGRPVKNTIKEKNKEPNITISDSIEKPYGYDMDNHMGNRNINENENRNIDKKGVQGEKKVENIYPPMPSKFNDPVEGGIDPLNGDDVDWNLFCYTYKIKPETIPEKFTSYQLSCLSQDIVRTRQQHIAAFAKWCLTWKRNEKNNAKISNQDKVDEMINKLESQLF